MNVVARPHARVAHTIATTKATRRQRARHARRDITMPVTRVVYTIHLAPAADGSWLRPAASPPRDMGDPTLRRDVVAFRSVAVHAPERESELPSTHTHTEARASRANEAGSKQVPAAAPSSVECARPPERVVAPRAPGAACAPAERQANAEGRVRPRGETAHRHAREDPHVAFAAAFFFCGATQATIVMRGVLACAHAIGAFALAAKMRFRWRHTGANSYYTAK